MAKFKRKKEALRASCLSFLAGIHSVNQEVLKLADSDTETQQLATESYNHVSTSPQAAELLIEILNQEELYPFANEWPLEAIFELNQKIILFRDGESQRFRFKKGFKERLNNHAQNIEAGLNRPYGSDHWMTSLINTTFFAGASIASQLAPDPKKYHAGIQELEMEAEPWNKYPQLNELFEKQLQRESKFRGGLVTDFDL